ncbi:MAG TPA: PEP-CTERM sorting domain-containing protein [Bryobacteraceae bacterium]
MRDFSSSPLARAFRFVIRWSAPILCFGAILYLGVPASGPDIPVRTIPDYNRIANLAILVSAPETRVGEFSQYVSWVTPPRSSLAFFNNEDLFEDADPIPSESDSELAQSVADLDAPVSETSPVAFFVPDSFGAAGWDLTIPDSDFTLSGNGGFHSPTPEPESLVLFATGLAGFAAFALYRRRRQSSAR